MQRQLLHKIIVLRANQTRRGCRQIGWFHVGFLALLAISFVGLFALFMPINPYILLSFYVLISISIHRLRQDYVFLSNLELPKEVILLAEYNLLVLPLTVIAVCHLNIGLIAGGHLLTSAVVFLPFTHVTRPQRTYDSWVRWIPQKLFEWRCFFRNHRFLWLFFYLPAVALSFYIFVVPLALLIFTGFLPEVFNHFEPKELIQSYPGKRSFLQSKLYHHSVFIHLLLAPLYFLFLLFHFPMWYLLVILVLLVEASLCFGLIYKYAHFTNASSYVHNQLPFLMFFAMMLLFFPAGLLFIYRCWHKATIKLSNYA